MWGVIPVDASVRCSETIIPVVFGGLRRRITLDWIDKLRPYGSVWISLNVQTTITLKSKEPRSGVDPRQGDDYCAEVSVTGGVVILHFSRKIFPLFSFSLFYWSKWSGTRKRSKDFKQFFRKKVSNGVVLEKQTIFFKCQACWHMEKRKW